MPKIIYEPWAPRTATLEVVGWATAVCEDYAARGYSLTLRQLYYRIVAAGRIPNTQESYNRLGTIVSKARMAGLIDWTHVTDRLRMLSTNDGYDTDPADAINTTAGGYAEALWRNQPEHVEVWVEKDALADVVGQAAREWRAPVMVCRGYMSQSAMWETAVRLLRKAKQGKELTIIHLGDHDPSGKDMTRDIGDRLQAFLWRHAPSLNVTIERLALNMDQVEQYDPPPNPAKMTDSRWAEYVATTGLTDSWELDALPPDVLDTLIREAVEAHIDRSQWEADQDEEEEHRRVLTVMASHWERIAEMIEDGEFD